jgi:hypothetical protein
LPLRNGHFVYTRIDIGEKTTSHSALLLDGALQCHKKAANADVLHLESTPMFAVIERGLRDTNLDTSAASPSYDQVSSRDHSNVPAVESVPSSA